MLVLDVLDVVTLNESKSQKTICIRLTFSLSSSGKRILFTTHTAKNPTVYIFPGKLFGVASGERCVDYFRFFDGSNMNQMLEVMSATKQGSAETKGNK